MDCASRTNGKCVNTSQTDFKTIGWGVYYCVDCWVLAQAVLETIRAKRVAGNSLSSTDKDTLLDILMGCWEPS